uniref:Uncharacterized protein n=1 Tax=Rhinopithecus bieti TaxID=61621 RepID=A0A2K6L739_RHIBE
MGGGRGLLGRETLESGGGCSGEGPLCQWPPLGSPQAVPCAPVPCRVVLAFVPGTALQAPAAAPGPHSGAGCLRPLVPAQPLPCTFGRCPALQLHKAGLLLHTGQTTHSRRCQHPSTPPDCQPTTSFCPQTYAATAIAVHRISSTDCRS